MTTIESPLLIGAVLGLALGIGLALLVLDNPWTRRRDLAARIDPYLRRGRGSALLSTPGPTTGASVTLRRLLGPGVDRVTGILERLTGNSAQLEKRLRMAGRRTSIESFRMEQLLSGVVGLCLGLLLGISAIVMRGASPMVGLFLVLICTVSGVIGRDYLLSIAVKRRAARMGREFPTIADLLALAVAAGEGPVAAMERVARTSSGALPDEFASTVAEIRAGATVSQALISLGERTPLESLGRFGEGVAVAIERGTPLADVLRAQAQDAREASKRDLMEVAGKREIAMLVPVVFFVMPLVIVFAIFPGLAVLDIAL
ncbi:MAG: type II secretion system F family protein [Brachybacterium sp.]|nr:type II secretion system F family protein [Brachybacterium sp.]